MKLRCVDRILGWEPWRTISGVKAVSFEEYCLPARLGLPEHLPSSLALESVFELARWLEKQPQIARVLYPGLSSHPQHALAMKQQKSGGGIVSFEVKGGKDAAWRVVDNTRLISITANLGDTKTTITHPASTTHGRISQEARNAAGISDGLLRVAVGLEALDDLKADLVRGLR